MSGTLNDGICAIPVCHSRDTRITIFSRDPGRPVVKAYRQGMAQLIDFDIRSIVVLPDQCIPKRGRKAMAIVIVGDGPLEP